MATLEYCETGHPPSDISVADAQSKPRNNFPDTNEGVAAASVGQAKLSQKLEQGILPAGPEELEKRTPVDILSSVVEWVLLLTPTIFIGLGIIVMVINGQPTKNSQLGQRLEGAVKLVRRIKLDLFHAYCTMLTDGIGSYPFPNCLFSSRNSNAQNCRPVLLPMPDQFGSTCLLFLLPSLIFCVDADRRFPKTLELLLASRSLWGTAESLLLLRCCTAIGVLLLLLWSLSPLGGQATLRALERTMAVTSNTTALRYLHTGAYATFLVPKSYLMVANPGPYLSELAASRQMKISSRDQWGNVRVPRLEMLPGFNSSGGDSRRWLPVPRITLPEQFTSLTGLPIVGLPVGRGNLAADFTVEVSYMALACSTWETFSQGDPRMTHYKQMWKNGDPFHQRSGDVDGWVIDTFNTTLLLDATMPAASKFNASAVAHNRRKRILHFVSAHWRGDGYNVTFSATNCSVTETHAEVAITCPSGRDCKATAMRRSLVDTRPESGTPMDSVYRTRYLLLKLSTVQYRDYWRQGDTEFFLHDSLRPVMARSGYPYVDLSEVPPPLFSSRLMLVLNSWYQTHLPASPWAFLGDNPTNLSTYGFDFAHLPSDGRVDASVVDESCRIFCTRGTEAVLTHSVEVFSYSRPWLALLLVSSTVLLATGITGAVLGWRTRVPDILGYVVSMTYNNHHLGLPRASCSGALDAQRRTRILRALPVVAGDVCGSSDIGKVAFTASDNVRMLEGKRKYT